jgi:hypothetical protein
MKFVKPQPSLMSSFIWWKGNVISQRVIEHLSKCQHMFWCRIATRRNKCSLCSQGAHNLRKLHGTSKPNHHHKGFEGNMHDSV